MSMDTMPPNIVLRKHMANINAILPLCFSAGKEIEVTVITSCVSIVSVFISEPNYFFSNGHNLAAIFCIHYLPIVLQDLYKNQDQLVLLWQVRQHNDCRSKT